MGGMTEQVKNCIQLYFFIIQDKANKEIYRKDSGTNSRETGSGSVNTSGFSLGLNRIGNSNPFWV